MNGITFKQKIKANLWALAMLPCCVGAMPSAPGEIVAAQPDGTPVHVVLRGDEHQSWYETQAGYTVVKNGADQWVYALPLTTAHKSATGNTGISESKLVVGVDESQLGDVTRHLRPGVSSEAAVKLYSRAANVTGNPILPRTGDVPLLVILGYYDDTKASPSCGNCATTNPEDVKATVFDADARSVSHYYRAASSGKLTVIPSQESHGTSDDGVVGWLRLGALMPAAKHSTTTLYKSNRIAADAINAAMSYVNFSAYDTNKDGVVTSRELGILIVVAGYEGSYGKNANHQPLADDKVSPRLWGQSRSFAPGYSNVEVPVQHNGDQSVTINTTSHGMTYSIIAELHGDHAATLGIMVHELGHSLFGLPDLYDVTGESSGVGVWSVMSYGSWGEGAQDSQAGETPVLPDAWMRLSLGWIEPLMPIAGSLHSAFAAADDQATIIKIPTAEPDEYFLVENRQHYGYDDGLAGLLGTSNFGGLAVWHIDDRIGTPGYNNDNADAAHKRVDLMAAVGDDSLDSGLSYGKATNLYYDGNSVKLDETTKPGTQLYSGNVSDFSMWNVSYSSSPMTFVVNNSKAAVVSNAENDSTLNDVVTTAATTTAASASSTGGGGALDVSLLVLPLLLSAFRRSQT